MIAGEAVIGLRIDGSAVAADAGDFAERLQRVEIEDGQARGDGGYLGGGVGGGHSFGGAARDVEPAAVGVGVDIVPATLAADPFGLKDFVWTVLLG